MKLFKKTSIPYEKWEIANDYTKHSLRFHMGGSLSQAVEYISTLDCPFGHRWSTKISQPQFRELPYSVYAFIP